MQRLAELRDQQRQRDQRRRARRRRSSRSALAPSSHASDQQRGGQRGPVRPGAGGGRRRTPPASSNKRKGTTTLIGGSGDAGASALGSACARRHHTPKYGQPFRSTVNASDGQVRRPSRRCILLPWQPYGKLSAMTEAANRNERNARLSAEDWAQAALDLIAEQGVASVAVEPLARRLGRHQGQLLLAFPVARGACWSPRWSAGRRSSRKRCSVSSNPSPIRANACARCSSWSRTKPSRTSSIPSCSRRWTIRPCSR